jgi:hypothetical protein
MKKYLYCLALLASCTLKHAIIGNYTSIGKDYKKDLTIMKDGTFILKLVDLESKAECHGKWRYLSNDTILLKCDTESFPAIITSGYIQERQQKAIVLDRNKINFQNTILQKHKESH